MTYKKLFFSAILLVTLCIQASAQLDTVGLIAHWPFNGNLKDSTGRGHDAGAGYMSTHTPAPSTFLAGINKKPGTALKFTRDIGVGAYTMPDVNHIKEFSICALVHPDSFMSQYILYKPGFWGINNSEPTFGAACTKDDA